MVAVYVLVALTVLGLLAGVHWYLWRRLIRDTTAPGGRVRRAGTVAAFLLPSITVAALVGGRAGVPFTIERVLAWPGYLWLALVLYLTLGLLVGEAVRPLLRLLLEQRDRRHGRDRDRRGAAPAGTETPARADAPGDAVDRVAGRTQTPGHGRAPVGAAVPDPAGAGSPVRTETAPAAERTVADADADALDGPAPAEPEPAAASPAVGSSRRLFVARTVAVGAAAAATGTVGYGTYNVLRGPRIKRVTVPLAKLPRAAHGFRIAVVSDIHLGPILGRAHAQRVVDTVNRTDPDLIAVVGDLVDGRVSELGRAAEPLRGLTARHGAYFVTGNHEYFSGAAPWVDHVRELGLHPLENARVEFPAFDLAGVNDPAGEREGQGPDFQKAFGDRDPARASVLLAHQPVVIHDAVDHGVDLQLSGHTHGGQIWPGNLVAALANPTLAGLERYGDTQLYVTRGAGAWGPPVRVGAPPDVTVVQLAALRA
ncbi:metallophosphoesterase [Streptomyces sp. LX-29]|uniref:metallophosphoesterase n=1 Tax=Streptomyces sp. LX-29 TaxID=2900152 RepID=UPI00240D6AB4|nr:metallophosphoesterase [Streptomyces sp. LX-29]WFB08991.1 metallophosphoesterase [Streptomyces sp. LX-29]